MLHGGALFERMYACVTNRTQRLFWSLVHASRRTRTNRLNLALFTWPLIVLASFCGAPSPVSADVATEPASSAPAQTHSFGRTLGIGSLGVLSGFLAHEAGHITANLAMGNVPSFQGFMYGGFVPFFAITPRMECTEEGCTDHAGNDFAPGRRGKYLIVTAGYHVQHISDEIILSRTPNLRGEYAPFRKGMLLFNVFLSTFYAAGAWTGLQDPHGDLEGAAQLSGIDQTLLSLALVAPAVIDTYRYFAPGSARWSAWAGRASKGAFAGLNFAF
jgi:hypothetical protein